MTIVELDAQTALFVGGDEVGTVHPVDIPDRDVFDATGPGRRFERRRLEGEVGTRRGDRDEQGGAGDQEEDETLHGQEHIRRGANFKPTGSFSHL
jgi:hypothetical protein